jgi:neutral ceramidase
MSFWIGTAKTDITPEATGVAMMGWGDPSHRVQGIATPLFARAIAISDLEKSKRVIMVSLDLCFITEYLRAEVLRRSGLLPEELVLVATHTHSAPGGFSSYVLYSLSNDGFIPEVFERYANQTVEAIRLALEAQVKGNIRFDRGSFAEDVPVAFNRSIRAYNRNPEVKKRSRKERHLAIDREMTLLRFEDEKGNPLAAWNWFAVHCTSVHRNRYNIHSDNKGLAANFMEEAEVKKGNPRFVAVFAQGAAGDVSPNFRYYLGLLEKRGKFRNDEQSCEFNARLQVDHALRLFESAKHQPVLTEELDSIFYFGDLSCVEVDSDLVGGKKVRTGPAEVGLSQFGGTAEGHGAPWFELILIRIVHGFIRFVNGDRTDTSIQGNKFTVIEAGESMIFGAKTIEKFPMPGWVNPMIATIKRWGRAGILRSRPFVPQILPLQIIRLGNLVIPVLPGEFTTVAGQRIKRMFEDEFCRERQLTVLLQGYANAFQGYTTTPEEYDQQGYEGGSTFFGKWSLPAYMTLYRKLGRLFFKETTEPLEAKFPTIPDEYYMKVLTRK